MANWEFFLQTIGEENWLRLNSTQPDLPSGHYRLAARAPHHAQELIEVEVKTRQKKETLTRQQKQQHSCQLDQNGFGILVNNIQLTPGFWEIQCRRELMNVFTEPDWEIKLSLRVTLHLEKAKGKLATLPKEETMETLRSRLIENADQMLEEVVSEVFSDINSHLHSAKNPKTENYSLHLDQEIFTTPLNKPIIISGEIGSHHSSPPAELRLDIILRDPRTGEMITQLSPRLLTSSFPFPFCYSLTISHPCHTYLLQGEITLTDATEKNASQVLAYQTFTVTANWEQLEPLVATAITSPNTFHPPAPLSPLSDQESSSQKWRGIFPPRLVSKYKKKKKTSPQLPNLPNTIVREKKRKPKKEYVWSQPDDKVAEEPKILEWELIPELVITSEDNKM
ncbi:MAG: hypothetical protein ACLFRN_11025 [Halothece sp.]